jgi:hypothetical protein
LFFTLASMGLPRICVVVTLATDTLSVSPPLFYVQSGRRRPPNSACSLGAVRQ